MAKSKGLDTIEGHKKGIETAKEIIKEAIDKKVLFLTLYAFLKTGKEIQKK